MLKHSVILSFLGQTKDRFHVYNEPLDLEEKIKLLSTIEGVSAAEVVYPYETTRDPNELKSLLEKYHLEISAVNVNVKAEPEFRNGGLTSASGEVRAKAVQFIKDAKDFAKAVGADKVTCCPLGDGYEYNFQCNYSENWKRLVVAFREAATHLPEIPLFVEYKPSETRGKCFIDSASKTVCLLRDVNSSGLGVTVDFGHAVYGLENPAEAVSLVHNSGFPVYIHINDNNGLWDWDFMAGTHHLLHYFEFLYVLQEIGYDGYLTSDTSPTRFDIRGTFEVNSRVTSKIWNRLKEIDHSLFNDLISGGDYLKVWKFIEDNLLRL